MLKTSNTFMQTGGMSNDGTVPAMMVDPMLQTQDSLAVNSSDVALSNGQLIPSINRTENLALATISISNDKLANSTKILVDTNQGRQLYQLNMSDLTGLLNNPVNGLMPGGQDQPEISASLVSPVKQEQYEGAQTIPGV